MLGLKKAAAEQANLITNAASEQNQQQAIARKFAHEMTGQPQKSTEPK